MASSTTITPIIRKVGGGEFVGTVVHFTTDSSGITQSSGITRLASEPTEQQCRITLETKLSTLVSRAFPGANVRPIEILNC